jgi:hypothetical protein
MKVYKYKETRLEHTDLINGQIVGIEFNNNSKVFIQRVSSDMYICANLYPDTWGSKIIGSSIPDLINKLVNIKELVLFQSSWELKQWL